MNVSGILSSSVFQILCTNGSQISLVEQNSSAQLEETIPPFYITIVYFLMQKVLIIADIIINHFLRDM